MMKAKLVEANEKNIHEFAMCGYKNLKNEGYKRKINWTINQFKNGLKYYALYSETDGTVGAIEYIPAENSWRPVLAPGFLFIHCICIMKKAYKNKGYGQLMLEKCLDDARKQDKNGVAVICRDGSWMADKSLFIKNGFEVVDTSPPDFELLVLFNKKDAKKPSIALSENKNEEPASGLVIHYSDQCPYLLKSVNDITEIAKKDFDLQLTTRFINSASEALASACPFGTYYITWNGKVIADHPVSSTHFKNIVNKIKIN